MKWSDQETVLSLLLGLLHPPLSRLNLSITQIRSLAMSIASAFTASIHVASNGKLSAYVLFESVKSPSVRSLLLPNTLLLDIPYRDIFSLRRESRNAVVALFESSIEVPVLGQNVSLDIDSSALDGVVSLTEAERQILDKYADIITASGIEVLFCQRRIHTYLGTILDRKGIMSVQRVSIKYISALARLSGAKLLGAVSLVQNVIPDSTLGCLKCVRWRNFGSKHLLMCEAGSNEENLGQSTEKHTTGRILPVATVLLSGLNDSSCFEMMRACTKAVRVLSHCLEQPFTLKGGGLWQHHLCTQLLKSGDEEKSKYDKPGHISNYLSLALLEFSLLVSGAPSTRKYSSYEEGVVDSFIITIKALECAVDAACCALGIDDIVYVKQS